MSFYDNIGGCGYGSRPCANCESEPAASGDLYCETECRAEAEGWTDSDWDAWQSTQADRYAWSRLDN
ncbi:hypothetical protein CPT_Shady_048 [Streptomyces phage Shady]|uniref:Uncharacterized protein n=1 Tax=Streptomyces phage Shady TaxID=2767585 RepID=A0A873WE97_9CAUD|nr:hypothetical protein CPT_Shady_048 [Streptomyces phage Shady]